MQIGPKVAETHFQLGLAYGDNKDWAKAAPAFETAIAVDPMLAYAHYYAGHSYYEAGRIDLMAKFFEYFLRLAPGEPDRTNVESIMRTVRGRRRGFARPRGRSSAPCLKRLAEREEPARRRVRFGP